MTINIIDIVLILLVLLSILRGTQQGFVVGLLGLLGWIGSLLLALRFYEPLAAWLGPRIGWSEAWDRPAAFLLLVLAGGGLIVLLGDALLRRIPRDLHRHSFNRLLGTLPGMIHGLITAAVVGTLLLTLPLPQAVQARARDSLLANQMAQATEQAEAALSPVFSAAIAQTLTTLTIQPESGETVALPFQVSQARPRPDMEARMLELVNAERQQEGLPPLEADPELTEVARRHSADMLARGYFSHTSVEGLSPFDRMNAAGVSYHIAGENLALAPTLELAHEGLMRSPGHRANILRPQFGRLGIGILDAGPHGLMVTQNFRN